MANLLEIREYLKGIYSRYDLYLESVFKFVLAVVTLMLIDMNIGYESRLQNVALIIIIGLLCSFLPVAVLVVIAAGFCLVHVLALSLECAVVVLALFLLMLLVYFRFAPSDSVVVILTPLCFALHIPYAIPICCGLAGTPFSAVSSCCGVVVYYVIEYIKANESAIRGLEEESTVQKFRFIVDGILASKSMPVMLAAFAVTVVLVYVIKRFPWDHSWTVAMFAGFFSSVITVLVGNMALGINSSVGALITGSLVSLLIAAVLKFFLFSVDYTRAESLQFEDDEYYYYVKAVPKMTVAVPEKKIKHINQRRDDDADHRKGAKDYPVFNNAKLDDDSYAGRSSAPSHRKPEGGSSDSSTLTRDTADFDVREVRTAAGSRPDSGKPESGGFAESRRPSSPAASSSSMASPVQGASPAAGRPSPAGGISRPAASAVSSRSSQGIGTARSSAPSSHSRPAPGAARQVPEFGRPEGVRKPETRQAPRSPMGSSNTRDIDRVIRRNRDPKGY